MHNPWLHIATLDVPILTLTDWKAKEIHSCLALAARGSPWSWHYRPVATGRFLEHVPLPCALSEVQLDSRPARPARSRSFPASPAGLLVALALLCSRCFGPVRPPPGTVRSDRSFLSPFSAQLMQRETMDGPPLLSLASQASHAAAAGRLPELPQRTSSSLVDSGLGGWGVTLFSLRGFGVCLSPLFVMRGRNCVIRSPRLFVTQIS